jgi:regulator of sigma E protease
VAEFQELASQYKGQEVVLTVARGEEVLDIALVPRTDSPLGEGAIGIGLTRVATKSYPWWQAPWQGVKATFNMTLTVIQGYGQAIANVFSGRPSGVEMIGPIGLFGLLSQAGQLGASYFMQFIGIIAIYIAIFNILPIPSVDGGKLLFLGIEAVRRRPMKEKTEQNITTVFFSLLLLLMVLITVKDVIKLF